MPTAALSLASFFSIEAREYTNFSFDADARATVRNVILGFCIGILLAALYTLYQKNVPGAIVRAIIRAEAFTPESARSAQDLGFGNNVFIRFELKHNVTLKHMLQRVSGQAENADNESADDASTDDEPDPDTDRYYIPEDLKYRAEVRFAREGNGPVGFFITAVLTIALGILLIRLLPALLGVIDNLMG